MLEKPKKWLMWSFGLPKVCEQYTLDELSETVNTNDLFDDGTNCGLGASISERSNIVIIVLELRELALFALYKWKE